MIFKKLQYLIFVLLFLQSCDNNKVNINSSIRPLQAPYEYFDQIDKDEFHFADLDAKLSEAQGKNNSDDIKECNRNFETAHNGCLKKLNEKFPVGSIQIPFEQLGSKDTVKVKSIYVSGFEFPWSTAIAICYKFTVEYELLKSDIWYAKVPLILLDTEGDVLSICHVPATVIGKTQFAVKAQASFRIFSKIIIN